MVIPEPGDDMALRRQRFAELRGLLDSLNATAGTGTPCHGHVGPTWKLPWLRVLRWCASARPYLEKGRVVEDHLYRRRQYGPAVIGGLVQKGFAAQDIGVVEVLAEQRQGFPPAGVRAYADVAEAATQKGLRPLRIPQKPRPARWGMCGHGGQAAADARGSDGAGQPSFSEVVLSIAAGFA